MDEKIRTIIISVGCFLVSLGAFYFLDVPQYKQAIEKDKQINQVNANINSKKEYNDLITQQAATLEAAGWLTKKASIEVNFADPLFFTYKVKDFFASAANSTNLSLGEVTSSAAVSVKASSGTVKTTTGNETTAPKVNSGTPTSAEAGANQATSSTVVSAYFNQIKGPVMKTTFNFTVTGTYDNFNNFLKILENQTRIITVNSVTLGNNPQASQQPTTGGGTSTATNETALNPNALPFQLVVDAYSY